MSLDLESWLTGVRQANSRSEIFALLDQFRPLAWTDEQRAAMARTYVRALTKLPPDTSEDEEPSASRSAGQGGGRARKREAAAAAPGKESGAPEEGAAADDGPVWYEKM